MESFIKPCPIHVPVLNFTYTWRSVPFLKPRQGLSRRKLRTRSTKTGYSSLNASTTLSFSCATLRCYLLQALSQHRHPRTYISTHSPKYKEEESRSLSYKVPTCLTSTESQTLNLMNNTPTTLAARTNSRT
jgi:hypothetical protein